MPLDADTVRLAKGKNLATVVTLMPDGQPQALLTWVDTDGEHLLVNTEPQRQRARNLRRDPRFTVLIHSAQRSVGLVRDTRPRRRHGGWHRARAHIDELSRKYAGADYRNPIGPQGRVILVIEPDKINTPVARSPLTGLAVEHPPLGVRIQARSRPGPRGAPSPPAATARCRRRSPRPAWQVRPAAYAAETSPSCRPASSPVGGSQIGSSVQASIPADSITSGETQTSLALDPVALIAASSRLAIVAWPALLTVLKAPPSPRSAAASIQAARSRQSMSCSGRSGGPGRQHVAAALDPAAATTASGRRSHTDR